MKPPMIPLTSHTPRLRQRVLRSPVARRHANTLPTKAVQIPMALRHHERTLATRSVHTLEANISHETADDPAHQSHTAFTPACFALPSGTAPRKHTSNQGRANPNGTETSRTYFGHTVCPPEANISHQTANDPAHHVSASSFCTPQQNLFPLLLLYYFVSTSESSSEKLFPVLHLYYKLATDSSSEKLFPVLHLHYKLATSESSSEKLLPVLHLHYELARSESKVFRTSVSNETSSKS